MNYYDVLIWVAFFGVIQGIGWLFYWRGENPNRA
jgi:hypothetical protein